MPEVQSLSAVHAILVTSCEHVAGTAEMPGPRASGHEELSERWSTGAPPEDLSAALEQDAAIVNTPSSPTSMQRIVPMRLHAPCRS